MDSNSDIEMRMACPSCGEVPIGAASIKSAHFEDTGKTTLVFMCPQCNAAIALACDFGSQAFAAMTTIAVSAIRGAANDPNIMQRIRIVEAPDDNLDQELEGLEELNLKPCPQAPKPPKYLESLPHVQSGMPQDTLQELSDEELSDEELSDDVSAQPDNTASQQPQENSADSQPANSTDEEPAAKQDVLNIRYVPVGVNQLMTFGVEVRKQPRRPASHTLTEEEEAQLEYFVRQLKTTDTVDDAIDEIDLGYNFLDSDSGDEPSDQ